MSAQFLENTYLRLQFDPVYFIPAGEQLLLNVEEKGEETLHVKRSKVCRRLDFGDDNISQAAQILASPSQQRHQRPHSPIAPVPHQDSQSSEEYFVPLTWEKGYSYQPTPGDEEQPMDLRVRKETK